MFSAVYTHSQTGGEHVRALTHLQAADSKPGVVFRLILFHVRLILAVVFMSQLPTLANAVRRLPLKRSSLRSCSSATVADIGAMKGGFDVTPPRVDGEVGGRKCSHARRERCKSSL